MLPTNVALPSALTINAPPGAPIIVFLDATPATDAPFGYGAPLAEPSIIEIGGPTTSDITALVTGAPVFLMPPTGIAVLPLATPVPVPPGTVLDVQAAMLALDPVAATGVSLSNCVRRTSTAVVGTAYSLGATTIPGAYIDVEQGDIDGDGDLDVVLVGCAGNITIHLTVGGALSPVAALTMAIPTATSCELVDLDNDNYLDIVVSQSVTGGGWLLNVGRPPPTPGTVTLGPWAGFAPVLFPFPLALGLGAANGNDIETADIDLDGDRDIVIACGLAPNAGEQNRLILNTTVPGALPTFADVTVPQYPLLFDDSEDIEFFDLDGDLDDDIVVGNFDGPAPITGIDWYILNLGGLQGGVLGTFGPATPFPGAPADETLDVVIGDINFDGAPDVYVANWYTTVGSFGGPPWGPPVADVLYMTVGGVPLSWTNSSALLPDSPLYAGATPLAAGACVDAEMSDYDFDGDLDILVPIGTKCLATAPPASGLRLLHNNLVEAGIGGGLMPPLVIDPAGWLPAATLRDHSDIEMGDFLGLFHDQDFGAATQPAALSPGGFYSAARN